MGPITAFTLVSVLQERLIRSIASGRGVLVTSYSTMVIHQDTLLEHDWHYVVLDEGHKIRNPDAQATVVMKQVGLSQLPGFCVCNFRKI